MVLTLFIKNNLKIIGLILCLFCCAIEAVELSVEISGVGDKLAQRLKEETSIYRARTEQNLQPQRIQTLHLIAESELIDGLKASGYYDATVEKLLEIKADQYISKFAITLNRPILLKKIAIINNIEDNALAIAIDDKINKIITTGDIITHAKYEDIKAITLATIKSTGRLSAHYEDSVLEIDKDQYIANIKLNINSGPQYYFGNIDFVTDNYSRKLLKKYLPFKSGDKFSAQSLNNLLENLNGSGLFNKVRIIPKPNLNDANDTTVPITIKLKEKPKNIYSGGIGYGTDTSFRGNLGWHHKRVGRPGHILNTGIKASSINNNIFASYKIPGKRANLDSLIYQLEKENISIDERNEKKIAASVMKSKQYKYFNNIIGATYLFERFRNTDATEKQSTQYFIPSTNFELKHITDNIFFDSGYRFNIKLQGALDNILAESSFIQAELNYRFAYLLLEDSRFIFDTKLGVTKAQNFDDIPPSLRYFAGGDNSIRGYRYQSLGTMKIDDAGKEYVEGTKHIATFKFEVEKAFSEKVSFATFYDVGNAIDSLNADFAQGVGIGSRIRTPIGTLKLDLAKPLNIVAKKKLRFHLTFSTSL